MIHENLGVNDCKKKSAFNLARGAEIILFFKKINLIDYKQYKGH